MSSTINEADISSQLNTQQNRIAIALAARLLGDTFSLLIIEELLEGRKRFGEIQEGLERITPQTLSGRLKLLEQHGFLTRQAYAEIPPRVEYELTDKGRAVSKILQALADFGQAYLSELPSDEDCVEHQ